MMTYYEVEITDNWKTIKAYQVVENGVVTGYVDEKGEPYKPPRIREERVTSEELDDLN